MLSSILSFPERGPYGKSDYRGNCSGFLVKALLEHFRPGLFVDPSLGGGTSADVVRKHFPGMEFFGFDLHSGFNLLKNPLIERLPRECDYLFWHPPYADLIPYSGNVWGSEPHPDDLSRCTSRQDFLEKVQIALLNIYEAVKRNGRYSILIGDLRRAGEYWSLQSDLLQIAPGVLDGVLIKEQFGTVSSRKEYSNSGSWVPITHEYLLNYRKTGLLLSVLDCAVTSGTRLVSLSTATWRAVIYWTLRKLGGKATLKEIYAEVSASAQEKTKANPNWEAKCRQVLQRYANPVERGVWQLREEG